MIFLLENFGLTVICKNENAINKWDKIVCDIIGFRNNWLINEENAIIHIMGKIRESILLNFKIS
jgi:hypothetical protein